MDTAQVMEMMKSVLAKMDENQAKSDAARKADKEEMLAAINANEETTTRMEANMGSLRDEVISTIKNFKFNGEETTACQETVEARLETEEPASVEATPEVAEEAEVPVQDAEVVPVGEPGKKRRDRRHLAAVRRQKEKDQNLDARRRRKGQERAQRKDGCRRNLVAARRGTTRRVQVARHNILSTKETRGYCGSQRRVIIVHRKMSRHITVAWRNRHIRSAVERATQSIGRLMKNL
jgi:hypothetical protein